ncbi:unnamed protein product [Orchesella dallaii]|uniref:Gustatory receptor n=1 Tax=Orchesella dallaii TaxID=48710 RepID=A0ABP1Q8T3_9HEXA
MICICSCLSGVCASIILNREEVTLAVNSILKMEDEMGSIEGEYSSSAPTPTFVMKLIGFVFHHTIWATVGTPGVGTVFVLQDLDPYYVLMEYPLSCLEISLNNPVYLSFRLIAIILALIEGLRTSTYVSLISMSFFNSLNTSLKYLKYELDYRKSIKKYKLIQVITIILHPFSNNGLKFLIGCAFMIMMETGFICMKGWGKINVLFYWFNLVVFMFAFAMLFGLFRIVMSIKTSSQKLIVNMKSEIENDRYLYKGLKGCIQKELRVMKPISFYCGSFFAITRSTPMTFFTVLLENTITVLFLFNL